MEECCLSSIIETQKEQLCMLIRKTKRLKNIPDYVALVSKTGLGAQLGELTPVEDPHRVCLQGRVGMFFFFLLAGKRGEQEV